MGRAAESFELPRPVVIVVTGLPGTGKSTIADRCAAALGAPSFCGDWLMGALKPAAAQLAQLDRPTSLRLYHGLLGSLITRQLMLRQSAIVDCIARDEILQTWADVARLHGADIRVVECICSDLDVHRSRVEGRARGIPGWHEIDWAHVERMSAEFAPVTSKHLTVDALASVEENVATVLAYIVGS